MRAPTLCVLALVATGLMMAGCLDRDLKPLNPCTVSGVVRKVKVSNVDKVDLLFMVDNSNSMAEEQTSLAEQFPRLVSALASGDINGDGTQDFPPVRSLRVGVVSSDMGTGGFMVPTCLEPNFGDDGVLRTQGNTSVPGCMAAYPRFLEFSPPGDAAAFAAEFTCVARMGTGGCGFEQQLEAVLKALTPSTAPIAFNMGTSGHGDGANINFARPDSLLTIIMVTDEEDCSAADPELFNPATSVYSGDLNLRCFQYPEAVHPVERYVDGLLALRTDPDLLIFAAITGVPPDLVADPSRIDYDAILNDDRMREMVDPTEPTRLNPSCNVPGRGLAFPPRRIVRVAQMIEQRASNGLVQSICQSDFTPALNAILEKLADVLGGACLPRELNPDAAGRVSCDVVEVLPAEGEFTTCAGLASLGRELVRTETDAAGRMHEVCRVVQTPATGGVAPAGPGWFYDNFSGDVMTRCAATPQRISYTMGAEPKTGTEVRLECLQPVQNTEGGLAIVDISSACTPGTDTTCPGTESRCARDLACDTALRTWQKLCTTDADCEADGLSGYRCDTGRADGAPICVNPTCS